MEQANGGTLSVCNTIYFHTICGPNKIGFHHMIHMHAHSHLDWIANTSFHNRKFARCRRSDLAWVKSQQSRVLVSLVFLSIPLRSAQLLTVYLQREAKHASFNQEHSRRRDGNISHLRAKKCISQAIMQCKLSFSPSLSHTHKHTIHPTHRGTTLHHWALHANLCYDLLNPVETKRKRQASTTETEAKKLF